METTSLLHPERLKKQAALLRKDLCAADPARATAAAERLRPHPPFSAHDTAGILEQRNQWQHKDFLRAIAAELGFDSWQALKDKSDRLLALRTARQAKGTSLLCPRWAAAYTNAWFTDYDTARQSRENSDGYLLVHDRFFLVVTADYVAQLGTDPEDPDWTRIGRDWTSDRDPAARDRLRAQIVHAQSQETNRN
jgi:hypothetical protein